MKNIEGNVEGKKSETENDSRGGAGKKPRKMASEAAPEKRNWRRLLSRRMEEEMCGHKMPVT